VYDDNIDLTILIKEADCDEVLEGTKTKNTIHQIEIYIGKIITKEEK